MAVEQAPPLELVARGAPLAAVLEAICRLYEREAPRATGSMDNVPRAIRRRLAQGPAPRERSAPSLTGAGQDPRRRDVILCYVTTPTTSGAQLHAEIEAVAPELLERMVFITTGAFTAAALAIAPIADAPTLPAWQTTSTKRRRPATSPSCASC